MKKTNTFKELNRHTEIKYSSDVYNGEYLDTDVYIASEYICTIEGNKLSEFHEKLMELINTYQI